MSGTIIIGSFKVKRGQGARQLFKNAGRVLYVRDSVVEDAPLISGAGEEEVELHFFCGLELPSDPITVERERKRRRLVRDLEAQLQYNQCYSAFADKHFNGDLWLNRDGDECFVSLGRLFDGTRYLAADKMGNDYALYAVPWFGGVYKAP